MFIGSFDLGSKEREGEGKEKKLRERTVGMSPRFPPKGKEGSSVRSE